MHAVDMFILFSIGHAVAWPVDMYVDNDFLRGVGHLIVATIGAFIAGYLSLKFVSETDKFGMIFRAFIGAGLLVYVVRFMKWR